jgi:transposase
MMLRMSARLVNIDRETPMLLPPDLRDWVEQDDLAHFLIDALEVLDLSGAAINERGSGSQQYPPGMMLVVLIYCYAQGIFSSRLIERATYRHVSVRYLAGNTHPDHDTIATFRRENGPLLRSVFVQLLQLAKAAGLLRLGIIAIDGTKLPAAAAKKHTKSLAQIDQELAKLEWEVSELLTKAEAADQSSSGGEQEDLPAHLAKAQSRREQLRAARAELERQARERHEEQQRRREEETVPERGKSKLLGPEPRPNDRHNRVDPQSRLLLSPQRGFIQGYNAQLALSTKEEESLSLIVAADVVREVSDISQLQPMTQAVIDNLAQVPSTVLADAGYDNTRQILHLQDRYGIEVLCPPVKIAQTKAGHVSRYRWNRQRHQIREAMRTRLKDPALRALYDRRNTTVEPAIAIVKNAIGFSRFRLRGLKKVGIEWTIVSLAFNCRRLAARKANWA